jgi:hypothetical protein
MIGALRNQWEEGSLLESISRKGFNFDEYA